MSIIALIAGCGDTGLDDSNAEQRASASSSSIASKVAVPRLTDSEAHEKCLARIQLDWTPDFVNTSTGAKWHGGPPPRSSEYTGWPEVTTLEAETESDSQGHLKQMNLTLVWEGERIPRYGREADSRLVYGGATCKFNTRSLTSTTLLAMTGPPK